MALWDAGQERVVRESRDRLAEQFVTARDAALHVLMVTGQTNHKGPVTLPAYIRPSGAAAAVPARPTGSPAARDRMLASLAIQFPGMVKRGDS